MQFSRIALPTGGMVELLITPILERFMLKVGLNVTSVPTLFFEFGGVDPHRYSVASPEKVVDTLFKPKPRTTRQPASPLSSRT
jgi:hypothetical protein